MSDDPYRKKLEAIAKAQNDTSQGRALRAEVERRIADYNAALSYARQKDKPYLIPGQFSEGGWVYTDNPKEMYVTVPPGASNNQNLAEYIAHEGMHQQREQSGLATQKRPRLEFNSRKVGPPEPVDRDSVLHPDALHLKRLRDILSSQINFELPRNFDSSPEEIYATYAGIEGRLPKGTAITSRPQFAEIAQNQQLKDLLFSETGGGIWEGQSQLPTHTPAEPMSMVAKILASGKEIVADLDRKKAETAAAFSRLIGLMQ